MAGREKGFEKLVKGEVEERRYERGGERARCREGEKKRRGIEEAGKGGG